MTAFSIPSYMFNLRIKTSSVKYQLLFMLFFAYLCYFAIKIAAVCHDCDLYLLFGFPFMPEDLLPRRFEHMTWTDADRNASQLLTTIFRQFAMYRYVSPLLQ